LEQLVKAALVLTAIVASVLAVACGGGDRATSAGAGAQLYKAPPALYDLVLTEADSGRAGISGGRGVAFLLDGRRDNLMTLPALAVKRIDDPHKQFPGKRAFGLPADQYGVFDVIASGAGMAAFTFHLVIGRTLPIQWPQVTVLHRGDVVVQEVYVQPDRLRGPTFDLLLDAMTIGSEGQLLENRPALIRRAYRAAQPGQQMVTSTAAGSLPYRVVVADTPASFQTFADGEVQVGITASTAVGGRLGIAFTGDQAQVSWNAQPAGAVVRLPDADIGPQPHGATLVPFRVMVEGEVTIKIRTHSPTSPWITISIQSGHRTCLPHDFPRYPLAHTGASSGDGPCQIYMEYADSSTQVLAFYSSRLNEGDWSVMSIAGDFITFTRRSNHAIGGSVEIGSGTIHIQLNTDTLAPPP
jgi:hypothetical protein